MEEVLQFSFYYLSIVFSLISGFVLKKVAQEEIKKYLSFLVLSLNALLFLLALFFIFDIRFNLIILLLLLVGFIVGHFRQELVLSLGVLFFMSLIFPSLLMMIALFLALMMYVSIFSIKRY